MEKDSLEVQFEELEREAALFARTWWMRGDGSARTFLDQHPQVRPRLQQRLLADLPTQTVDVYAGESKRDWDESRVNVQRAVLSDLDAADEAATRAAAGGFGKPADELEGHPPSQDAGGNVYFVLGLPGSGKTKVLRGIAARHAAGAGNAVSNLVASDADEVRVNLPEYAEGLGSGVVQVETVVVTYGELHLSGEGRQDRVLARGGATIVDVIGDPVHLPRTIRTLAGAGRSCFVLLADAPVEVCQQRAKRRAVDTGRLVPLVLIEEKAGVPRAALDGALATKLVAGYVVVDTSGAEPRITDGDGVFDKCLDALDEESQ